MRTAVQEAVSEDLHEVGVGDPPRNHPSVQAEVSERGCVRDLHNAGPVLSPSGPRHNAALRVFSDLSRYTSEGADVQQATTRRSAAALACELVTIYCRHLGSCCSIHRAAVARAFQGRPCYPIRVSACLGAGHVVEGDDPRRGVGPVHRRRLHPRHVAEVPPEAVCVLALLDILDLLSEPITAPVSFATAYGQLYARSVN